MMQRPSWFSRRETMPDPAAPHWEQALINRLALEHLRQQRRAQRWGIVFKLLILLYLLGLLLAAYAGDWLAALSADEEHVALIQVEGIIAAEGDVNADRVIGALRKAFEADAVKGVILRLNSPGGSPVQAGYINDEIRRLKAKYLKDHERDLPVYAVATDICASGAYYIAVGADFIYADKGSLIGSIGVRLGTFGLERTLDELGIERRLMIAGENKGILDPFSPFPPDQREAVQSVLDTLHRQFIAVVETGRGERLKGGDAVFSGLFWSGEEALELGLIDGLGSSSFVARDLIGTETLVDYTQKRDLIDLFARRLGASFGAGFGSGLAMGFAQGLTEAAMAPPLPPR